MCVADSGVSVRTVCVYECVCVCIRVCVCMAVSVDCVRAALNEVFMTAGGKPSHGCSKVGSGHTSKLPTRPTPG